MFRAEHPARTAPLLQLDILQLRRTWSGSASRVPMRQAIDRLGDDASFFAPELVPYVRDVTDRLLRTVELTDGVREVLTTIVDIRTAQSAHQLNEVMKKLTAWAGIVLVPTLIAGMHGMNFEQMPELHWTVGYPLSLGMMAISAVALYLWFKKRGWL